MIRVPFIEPADAKWKKWLADAKAAADKVADKFAAGEKPDFSDALYKRMREVYYEAFHGKCAYCERKFVLDQSGDIDHYRPKGAVTDENDLEVVVTLPAGKVRHPGYYWLAYDWRNLLPCCARCNRPTKLANGRLVGKSTRFPVQGGAYALTPGDESKETPLFIHPLFEDPEKELGLDTKTGLLFHKSDRGKFCIEKLDLNREGLPEERRKRYTEARLRMISVTSHLQYNRGDEATEELNELLAFSRGTAELSWAGRIAFEEGRKSLTALLALLNG
jgi:hypothetical protein